MLKRRKFIWLILAFAFILNTSVFSAPIDIGANYIKVKWFLKNKYSLA